MARKRKHGDEGAVVAELVERAEGGAPALLFAPPVEDVGDRLRVPCDACDRSGEVSVDGGHSVDCPLCGGHGSFFSRALRGLLGDMLAQRCGGTAVAYRPPFRRSGGAAHPDVEAELHEAFGALGEEVSARGVGEVKHVKGVACYSLPESAEEYVEALLVAARPVTPDALVDVSLPVELCSWLVGLARLKTDERVLVPRAGLSRGGVVRSIVTSEVWVRALLHEPDPDRRRALDELSAGKHVTTGYTARASFLDVEPAAVGEVGHVVLLAHDLNERPDAGGNGACGSVHAHVEHALRFLRPGGSVVALVSSSVVTRHDPNAQRLRGLVLARGGAFVPVPDFIADACPLGVVALVVQ